MGVESRVAVRYADALISLAQEQSKLEQVKEGIDTVQSTIDENRDLKLFLKNPVIPSEKKAEVLKSLFEGKVDALVSNVLNLVCAKDRADVLEDITYAAAKQYEEIQGVQTAVVRTAFAIDEELRTSFAKKVQSISGKTKVKLTEIIDESLIGGFILQVDDKQIDTSIASQLKQLKLTFSK